MFEKDFLVEERGACTRENICRHAAGSITEKSGFQCFSRRTIATPKYGIRVTKREERGENGRAKRRRRRSIMVIAETPKTVDQRDIGGARRRRRRRRPIIARAAGVP